MPSARSVRAWRVSKPWMVLAAAQRCRPCYVRGPVDAPPWNLHFVFPFDAGAAHCCLVRLDMAWQRSQVIRPPAVSSLGCFSIQLHLVRGSFDVRRLYCAQDPVSQHLGAVQAHGQTNRLLRPTRVRSASRRASFPGIHFQLIRIWLCGHALLPLPSQGSVAQGMDTGCQSTDGCLAPVFTRYAFGFIDHVPQEPLDGAQVVGSMRRHCAAR